MKDKFNCIFDDIKWQNIWMQTLDHAYFYCLWMIKYTNKWILDNIPITKPTLLLGMRSSVEYSPVPELLSCYNKMIENKRLNLNKLK